MVTTPVAASSAPEPPALGPINHFGRLIGVFFSPKETFQSIAARPSWLVPVLLMTVLGIVTAVAMNQKVDWRDVASKKIEESPRAANLTAEQKERQVEMSAKVSPYFTYVFGTIGPLLAVLIVAGVLLAAYNVMGGAGAKFGQSMGIVSHAMIVGLIATVFLIVVLFLKPPGTIDLENPVATNIGAFLPESTSKALMALARSVDIFTIWTMLLVAMGFAAVNPKKLAGKSLSIVLSVWAVYVACKMGLAWIFS